MSQNFSVQIGVDDQSQPTKPGYGKWEAQPATPKSPAEQPSAGPVVRDPAERSGAVVFRNGEVSVVPLQRASVQLGASESSDPLDNGRDGTWRNLIPRSALKGDSIVKLNGVEGDLAGFERLGLVEKGPDGQYRHVEQKQQEAPKQDTPVPMEKISDAGEQFFSHAAERLGPTTTHALVLAVIEGRELKMSGSHASTLHMEPAHFSRAVEKLTGEFQAQAKSALGLDDAGFAAFTEHVWQHHPNEIREAIMAQVDNGNMQPLRALGQKFAATGQQWDDDSLLDAEVPSGARVWRDSITGKVMVSQNGHTSTLRQAIASGEARVSRRK